MNREAIYSALFALVSQAPGLVTTSRKLLHWSDVSPSQRPAMFMAQKSEQIANTTALPGRWTLMVDLYVYVSTQGADNPGAVLNPILDYITATLGNQFPGQAQTLGGLVQFARVDGMIMTDEGTLGDDAVAIIPVHILTTA
jgi:hypothetical protein